MPTRKKNQEKEISHKTHGLSVVIPCRNEEATIGMTLTDTITSLEELGLPYEVLVVDDGSVDNTAKEAETAGATIIKQGPPHGKGLALRAGFARTKLDIIVMLDGDYSHRPEDIATMYQEYRKGFGLVVANRFIGGSDEYHWVRSIGNRFLTWCFNFLFDIQLNDALNGFKMFSRKVYDSFEYTSKDFAIEIELLANTRNLDLSIGSVPSHERSRAGGVAKSFPITHGTSFLNQIILEYLARNKKRREIGDQKGSF